jgi:ABC-type glycerol-3-phosphate transport system substrate-binding protein
MEFEELDKSSPIPLHWQLREQLRRKIERGELRSGERLPTEQEFCEALGISRSPVRQALEDLAREGWIARRRGAGTYVSDQRPQGKILQAVVSEEWWATPLREAAREQAPSLELSVVGKPQLRRKLISAVARGKAPDIALIDSIWLAELAALDFLLPIGEIDAEVERELKEDLFPAIAEDSSYCGRLYGIQLGVDLAGLWYRSDRFEAEGLSPPKTWDELLEAARRFKRLGLEYPVAFAGGREAEETTTYQFLALLQAAGGRFFDEEKGEIVLGEAAHKALKFLQSLVTHGLASPDVARYEWDQAPKLLAAGKAAIIFGGSYEKEMIQGASGWSDEGFFKRVGFLPVPAGPDGGAATLLGGMSYVIFRQSRDPEGALELLYRAAEPRAMERFCLGTFRIPARRSVAFQLGDEWLRGLAALVERAALRPSLPEYARISLQIQWMVERVLTGELTVRQAVAQAESIIAALLGRGS